MGQCCVVAATAPVPLEAVALGKDFSLVGEQLRAKIVEVHDGDTVRAVFDYCGQRMQWKCRLSGIDAPELRPPLADPDRDATKRAAEAARDALAARVLNRVLPVTCGKFDKYGRLLVTIRDGDGPSVNDWMVANGHAVAYDGGTKNS